MFACADALYVPTTPTPSPPRELTIKEAAHAKWVAAEGDKTLRLNYPLNRNSIVFDVGGFEGQWASDIFSRYLCRIHIFEPVPEFASGIARRFAANDRIKVHAHALGASPGDITLTVKGDASSVHLLGDRRLLIHVVSPESVLEAEGIHEVALMKVNIEGAEYDLLEHLLTVGLIDCICELQVQFHDFLPEAEARMIAIQKRLAKTHNLTYQFPFIWENWKRKDVVK